MNKNKGFIGIGLIIAIVLGMAVVGGGAYYLGTKNQNKGANITPSQYYSTEEYKINNPQANCKPNSPSAIKLISPNGGEMFKAGDKITIKWESCNVDPGSVGFSLIKRNSTSVYSQRMEGDDKSGFVLGGFDPYKGTEDDGIQEIILPKDLVSGNYYIAISGTGDVTKIGSGYIPEDYSDGLFTINSATKDVSTTNWKTYGNYGLSFKYPDTWSKYGEDSKIVDLSGNVVAYEINFKDIISNTTLLVSYHLPPNGSELYNYAVSEFNSKHGWYEIGSKEISVAGGKAIEAFTTMNIDGKGNKINPPLRLILVDFLDKQKTGSIQLQFKTPLPNEEIEVAKFNKFLSTFQILLPS